MHLQPSRVLFSRGCHALHGRRPETTLVGALRALQVPRHSTPTSIGLLWECYHRQLLLMGTWTVVLVDYDAMKVLLSFQTARGGATWPMSSKYHCLSDSCAVYCYLHLRYVKISS